MPAPAPQLIINEPSGISVRCLWFVGYVNEALPEPARSDPSNLIYAEYGPPILCRPNGEAMTLEQLKQNPTWESKTTDDILLAMVRAQLAAKRHADQNAAIAAAAANERSELANVNDYNDPPAAAPTSYIYKLDPNDPNKIRRVRVTRERQGSDGIVLRRVQGADNG